MFKTIMSPKSQDKHPKPFFISALGLCNNKHLKLKRSRWLQTFSEMRDQEKQNALDKRKKQLTPLHAVETIDLLSDEDDTEERNNIQNHNSHQQTTTSTGCYETNVEPLLFSTATIPYSPSIPPPLAILISQSQSPALAQLPTELAAIANKNCTKIKNRRKTDNPCKCAQLPATVECSESIILSDDEDGAESERLKEQNSIQQYQPQPQIIQTNNSIQVDEVTVSLVPRNRANQNLHNHYETMHDYANNIQIGLDNHSYLASIFPMAPDETTVQTVIANRTYELSLAKLRKGLASCGIPRFSESCPKANKTEKMNASLSPLTTTPQQTNALNLSNDLSISLISDDDDSNSNDLNGTTETSDIQISAALLQKLPLNVSIAPVPKSKTSRTIPKRNLS